MLTTIDNPYDPFTQFDDWKAFDELNGYYTCEYLARICNTYPEMTKEESDYEIQQAIDEICKLNVLGVYKKVTRTAT